MRRERKGWRLEERHRPIESAFGPIADTQVILPILDWIAPLRTGKVDLGDPATDLHNIGVVCAHVGQDDYGETIVQVSSDYPAEPGAAVGVKDDFPASCIRDEPTHCS